MALTERDRITSARLLGTTTVPSGAYLNLAATSGLKIAGTSVSATAANLNLLSGLTAGTIAASKAATVDANKGITGLGLLQLTGTASGGAAAANAILAGVGTSASPCTWSAADKNGVELRTQSSATTGDSRGIYVRHELSGIGGSGEALRGNSVVSAAGASTMHGVHGGLTFETNGKITGLGVGIRATLQIPDRAMASGGTYSAGLSECYIDGNSSDLSGATELCVHRFSVNGPGNAAAADRVPFLWAIDSTGNDGTGKLIYTHVHAVPTNAAGSIKCKFEGVTGYFKWFATE